MDESQNKLSMDIPLWFQLLEVRKANPQPRKALRSREKPEVAQWIDDSFQPSSWPCFTSILRAGEDDMTKRSRITVHSRFDNWALTKSRISQSFEGLPQSTWFFKINISYL